MLRGTQTGERLLVARLCQHPAHLWDRGEPLAECGHTVPSMPTPEILEIAMGLAETWVGGDWDQFLNVARRLTRRTG